MNIAAKEVVMKSNAGFSLVGILMFLGTSLTALLLVSQSKFNLRLAGKALDSSESYKLFITNFTDFIQKTLNANLNNLCSGDISGLSALTFNDENAKYVNNIEAPLTVSGVSELKARCANSQFNASGVIYFCLDLHKNSTFPKDEFGGADYNFIEVLARTVNKLQQPISCSDYTSNVSHGGLQIYYRLLWIPKIPSEKIFQKYGFYYATQN